MRAQSAAFTLDNEVCNKSLPSMQLRNTNQNLVTIISKVCRYTSEKTHSQIECRSLESHPCC